MARNAEKAMTTLARWRAAQLGEDPKKKRRPYLASECRDVGSCQKWRLQVIREIAKKVSQIQNAGLGEFRIRDLNDEINKLLREKGHWEAQIRELGGPDHFRSGPRMLDHEGKEVPGNRGYKYFGAARQLPGVRELFEQAPPPPPHKTRSELMRDIDATYYGYMDDDDGILIPLETAEEERAIETAVSEWKAKKQKILAGVTDDNDDDEEEEDIYKISAIEESSDESDSELTAKSLEGFRAHIPVPSQSEIQEAILQRKKQELLEKYASAMEEDDDDDDDEGQPQDGGDTNEKSANEETQA